MSAHETAFDWRTLPLHGRPLVEASAGTGKTFTIGLLFLRLLLERGLDVERILLVTFTEAAAQELRERLRLRLLQAEAWLAGVGAQAGEDPLLAWLADFAADADRRRAALTRVRLARAEFDRAPISTIHGWCQRVLREHPFDSGSGFDAGELLDEGELLRECFEDFWRRRFLSDDASAIEVRLLAARGVDHWFAQVRGLFAAAAPRFVEVDRGVAARLERLLAPLRGTARRDELAAALADEEAFAWHRNRRGVDLLRRLAVGRDLVDVLLDADDQWDALCTDKLAQLQTKSRTRDVAEIAVVGELAALSDLLCSGRRALQAAFLADAYDACTRQLAQRLEQRGAATYGALIERVHGGLHGPRGAVLAQRLFDACPAALIDEFQDTDERQYAIFDRIYRDRGLLVLIGDPKQAIYGFRGGDVHAYLRARTDADSHHALHVNYRASAALVEALNGLYGATSGGFGLEAIRYRPVRAAARDPQRGLLRDGTAVARPLVLHVPTADDLQQADALGTRGVRQQQAEALALAACAEHVVALLSDRALTIAGRPVQPGDVAVLLPTNRQLVAMREQLALRGVPCVGAGRASVLEGAVAEELYRVLHAVLEPADEGRVRAALATRLLGFDWNALRALDREQARRDAELQRFEHWHLLWRDGGVLAVVEALAAARAPALLQGRDGERTLTDLRHLGELLQLQSRAHYGAEALLDWFARVRCDIAAGSGIGDERELRIESQSARVQLATVHASKGLEYGIVLLPLAWRAPGSTRPPAYACFHGGDDDRLYVDAGSAAFDAHLRRHHDEALQERLRTLYVALTRARHACHVTWIDDGRGAADSAETSALAALLHDAFARLGGDAPLQALGAAVPQLDVVHGLPSTRTLYRAEPAPRVRRRVAGPLPRPREPYWLSSFSHLVRHAAGRERLLVAAGSEDRAADEPLPPPAADTPDADPRLRALHALRGPGLGDAVHAMLQHRADGPLWPQQRALIQGRLDQHAVRVQGALALPADEAVGRWLDRVLTAPLAPGLTLAGLARAAQRAEFEFQFPLQRADLAALRALCRRHGEPALIPASLGDTTLNGMMKGFIDLVFGWDARWHVLDYKTNWLGDALMAYRDDSLTAAMDAHHYRLQALLYTVALHRYLRQRIHGYAYERHCGDSWYLFLRGFGIEPGHGLWRHRWPAALVHDVDALFAGRGESAA